MNNKALFWLINIFLILQRKNNNAYYSLCFLPSGVEENSLDSFVFDTLIPKPITQRYFNLLMEHHRIILSGPSGTGKTYLANKLAEYVIAKSGRKKTEDAIATFNVDHKSSKVSHRILRKQLLFSRSVFSNQGLKLQAPHMSHIKKKKSYYVIL